MWWRFCSDLGDLPAINRDSTGRCHQGSSSCLGQGVGDVPFLHLGREKQQNPAVFLWGEQGRIMNFSPFAELCLHFFCCLTEIPAHVGCTDLLHIRAGFTPQNALWEGAVPKPSRSPKQPGPAWNRGTCRGEVAGKAGTARSLPLHPAGHVNVYGRCLLGLEIPSLPLPQLWNSKQGTQKKGKCDHN